MLNLSPADIAAIGHALRFIAVRVATTKFSGRRVTLSANATANRKLLGV